MNVFDCHVNRSPVEGRVVRISYRPGLFLNADLDKASEDNERNGLVIDSAAGRFGVVQIAGLVARRIVCFTQEGGAARRRRPLWPDPLRLAGRRLSARRGERHRRARQPLRRRRDGDRADARRRAAAPVQPGLRRWTARRTLPPPALRRRAAARAGPERRDADGAQRRRHRDPLHLRGLARMGGDGDRRRGGARRSRRPHRARPQRHLALRRGARFARRFRRFRRRAGDRDVFLGAFATARARLARLPAVLHRLRAAAGALQRDDRRSRHPRLAQGLLRRHAGAGGRGGRAAAGLSQSARRRAERAVARGWSGSRRSMCSPSPF